MIKEGFDSKNSTFALFYVFSKKRVTMTVNGICRIGVLRH